MSQAFPSLDLDSLPPPVRAVLEMQAKDLEGERAARVHLEGEVQELAAHNTRLEHLVRELQRARFGRKSEKLDADQLALTFEDMANHWDGLSVFLDDGRVEMDTNPVENLIRPLTLNRKNALFCSHDEGGASWARIASLVETCKLNRVNPYDWLRTTLKALVQGHPSSRLDELLPWNFRPQGG